MCARGPEFDCRVSFVEHCRKKDIDFKAILITFPLTSLEQAKTKIFGAAGCSESLCFALQINLTRPSVYLHSELTRIFKEAPTAAQRDMMQVRPRGVRPPAPLLYRKRATYIEISHRQDISHRVLGDTIKLLHHPESMITM